MRILAALSVLALACTCPPETAREAPLPPGSALHSNQASGTRQAKVPKKHPDFERVEGVGLKNQCSSDTECFVGGCEAEICTAVEGLRSTCKGRPWPSADGMCGCVVGQCQWYTADATN